MNTSSRVTLAVSDLADLRVALPGHRGARRPRTERGGVRHIVMNLTLTAVEDLLVLVDDPEDLVPALSARGLARGARDAPQADDGLGRIRPRVSSRFARKSGSQRWGLLEAGGAEPRAASRSCPPSLLATPMASIPPDAAYGSAAEGSTSSRAPKPDTGASNRNISTVRSGSTCAWLRNASTLRPVSSSIISL